MHAVGARSRTGEREGSGHDPAPAHPPSRVAPSGGHASPPGLAPADTLPEGEAQTAGCAQREAEGGADCGPPAAQGRCDPLARRIAAPGSDARELAALAPVDAALAQPADDWAIALGRV